MEFVEVDVKNAEMVDKIVKLEEETFGDAGGVDYWVIKALLRYGKVFALLDKGDAVSVIEYMQKFQEPEVFLYGISTKNSYKRRGLAKELVRKSEDVLKTMGIKKIILTVDPENHIAIDLYKKEGYMITDLQENEYGEGVHRYFMEKELTF